MGLKINIGLYDVDTKKDLTATTNSKLGFVDLNDLKKEVVVEKYATLEDDFFLLDGSFETFPDNPLDMGYWSELSDQYGDISAKLTFDFTKLHSSVGLTFQFLEDFPLAMTVIWYSGTSVLRTKDYNVNSLLYVVHEPVDNYNKVEVIFKKTLPYRYVKLESIEFGILKVFQGDSLVSANLLEEVNPISSEISINELSFKLYDKDKNFNISNPDGIYRYFQNSQKVEVINEVNGVEKQFGVFYLSDWSQSSANVSNFKAVDLIGIMDETTFKDGKIYNNTAEEILDEIMVSAGIDNYNLADDLKGVILKGWIPICSHREALQQVAFALGAIVDTSRSGTINISKQIKSSVGTIGSNRKYTGGRTSQRKYVSGVEIKSHNYVLGAEVEELFKSTLGPGNYEIAFDTACSDFTFTNCTMVKNSPNYVIINVASQGEAIVSGKKYIDQTSIYSANVYELPAGQFKNVVRVENATLASELNSFDLARNALNYYSNRQIEDFRFKVIDEKVGNWVNVVSSTGYLGACGLESLKINLTGGFAATAKTIGFNKSVFGLSYTGELYTSDLGVI